MTPDFVPFPKIARLSRDIIITEKLDGTNAQVHISEDGDITAGSRSRWITTKDDNYGFARWVEGNKTELLKLGPGGHFGEWWGKGIQRGYKLQGKRFSLFNVSRWDDLLTEDNRPLCCSVVPILYKGEFDTIIIKQVLADLENHGSYASPGFMDPEGIVIFHSASRQLFKKTIKGDESPKGLIINATRRPSPI